MPLTEKGKKIKRSMKKEYGSKKGEKVFYASKNKGTISGVEKNENLSNTVLKKINFEEWSWQNKSI